MSAKGDGLRIETADGKERELPADRLSPQVRESGLGEAIPTIPIEAIRDFPATCHIAANLDTAAVPDTDVFADCLRLGLDEVLAVGRG